MDSGKKYIALRHIIDLKNYSQSFNKWMKIRQKFRSDSPQIKNQLFHKYMNVIKPIIGIFHQTVTNLNPQQYAFYQKQIDEQTLNVINNQFIILYATVESINKYQILQYKPQMDQVQIQDLFKKQEEIVKMNLEQCPKNMEIQYWGNYLEVVPISFEGTVIKGKGLGTKTLGMPTANLQISNNQQQAMSDYPNGIYEVDFIFKNGNSHIGAGSLGTNPQYQNFQTNRIFQAYVLHDFKGETFYGETVKINLKKLIRFQGKFSSFSNFLNAMHNDIETIRLLNHLELIKRN